MLGRVTPETFRSEIAEAVKAYDKYVICIDKTPHFTRCSRKPLRLMKRAAPNCGTGSRWIAR
jgi:hypothetical protein